MNTVCSLKTVAVDNYVIAALDQAMLTFCEERTLPCYRAWEDAKQTVNASTDL